MGDAQYTFDDGRPENVAAGASSSQPGYTFDDGKPENTAAPPETASRVAGLGGRALMQGVGQLEDAPRNLAHAVDAGAVWLLKRAGVISQDFQLPTPEQVDQATGNPSSTSAAAQLADKAGLPTPATPAERIGSAAVAALPSGVLAPEAPIAGALWSAAGGAASQGVGEAGGSPVAQTLAGLAVGGAPLIGAGAAGLARTVTRGAGDAAAQAAQARIANAADTGTTLTAAQVTQSPTLERLEASSGRLWGGGPVRATQVRQNSAIGSRVNDIVENLAQGTEDLSPTGAGSVIDTGIKATKASMRADEKAAYDKVAQLVPATTPVDVSGTLAKLNALATPTAGAEVTTGALISPKIAQLRDNLAADTAANGGTLPYAAARQVRTALGNAIDWGFSPSDPVANGALKQAHGALSADLDAAASAVSPEAAQATRGASALYAANQARRQVLNSVIDKAGGPEAVYQAALAGTDRGATKIGQVMGALDPDSQRIVQASVIDRLGRAIPSQQNDLGDVFDASRFLTQWNRLSPQAKDALFGASGAPNTLRKSLDSLTSTMSTLREAGALHNASGTAAAAGHNFGLLALLFEGAHSIVASKPAAIMTGGLAVGGNMILSRALTNPRTAAWLAQTTKLPPSALPNAVNQLSRLGAANNDPDASNLAAYLRSQDASQ